MIARAGGLLRTHWLFVLVLAAGVVLRAATQLAYRPVLVFYDSTGYLDGAVNLTPVSTRPLGYSIFLAPLIRIGDLSYIAVVQHLIALLAAILLYATLVRLGLWPWLAALGTLPFLIDAYQLDIEQWVMSDTVFEVLLIIGFCALLWHRRPGWIACIISGIALALAVWVRFAGIFMIAPAVLFLLLALPGWKLRLRRVVVICIAFAIPIGAYGMWYRSANGEFKISSSSGPLLYARAASFVDCSGVKLPDYEKPLCPNVPLKNRLPTNCYAWCAKLSPAGDKYTPPPGMDKDAVLNDFAKRVFKAEPLAYAKVIAGDFLHGFQWGRSNRREDIAAHYWNFSRDYPKFSNPGDPQAAVARFGGPAPISHPALTGPLAQYQKVVYTHGPFLALGLVLGLAAAFGLGRARRSGLRSAALLWPAGGLVVTLLAYAVSQFTWRYQMPLTIFYPVAGAIGLFAILGGQRRGHEPATAPAVAGGPVESSTPVEGAQHS